LKFRHLIAVPFKAHGSDLLLFREEVTISGIETSIIPAARLSALDFSLLKDGFEKIPAEFLSRSPAKFAFDQERNMITYTGFPSTKHIFEYLCCSENLTSLIHKRNVHVDRLQTLARSFAQNRANSDSEWSSTILEFCDSLKAAIPYLLLSTTIDEMVFERAWSVIDEYPEKTRLILHGLVFTSPFTRLNISYPLNILKVKRIHLPTTQFFVTEGTQEIYLQLLNRNDFFAAHAVSIEEPDLTLLWFCKVMYQMSEELAGVWASLISTLSFMITKWAWAAGCSDLQQLYQFTIRDLVSARNQEVI
jgi:hypothetical protein